MSEQFCDVAKNEEVFRSFGAEMPASGDVLVIPNNLASAVLAAPNLEVSGSQQTLSDCANPTGIPVTTSLGTSRVLLAAAWQATGPLFEVLSEILCSPRHSQRG